MIRAFALIVLVFVSGFVLAKPQRIASLSLCTDQILLALVDKQRIASVTFLAVDPVYSDFVEEAAGIPIHYDLAEQIIPLNPDLVIGLGYSNVKTQQMLTRLGFKLETFNSPVTLEDIDKFTMDIARLLGEEEKAKKILQAMHAEIKRAKDSVSGLPHSLAISYGPNGYTAGKHTIKHQVFELVGFRNVAADLGIEHYGNLSVEQLLAAKPEYIIIDEAIDNQDSLAQQYVNHPVLKKLYSGKKMPSVDTKYWLCPGPSISKAISSLAKQRL